MDDNIKALKKHLSSIEEIISNLEEKDTSKDIAYEIDINKIDKLAKQAPFKGHFISEYDEDVIRKYIVFLGSVAREADNIEKRTREYYFIERILHGLSANISISEWVTKAELVELSDIEFVKETIDEKCPLLAFDILLMISMDGVIDERQMNYFCEILSYLSLDKGCIRGVIQACACVLEGNEKGLFECAKYLQISKLSCYLQNPIQGGVYTSLVAIGNAKESNVIIVGENYKNESIDIDSYGKKSIKFLNCKFENIASIKAKTTTVIFEKCYFSDCICKYEKQDGSGRVEFMDKNSVSLGSLFESAMFSLDKVSFIECDFNRCGQSYNMNCGGFISFKEGTIINCSFKDCFVEVEAVYNGPFSLYKYCEYASLIIAKKCVMYGNIFNSCNVYGDGRKRGGAFISASSSRVGADYQYLSIIYSQGGNIENTNFISCSVYGRTSDGIKKNNYIINSKATMLKENSFSECKCMNNMGTVEMEF